ncbi:MAG: hypothetical protein KUG79_01020 [Pseudomonadales bacterium]|nr:hypothetical protein [Pseudomonadales bacterium]
MDRKALFRQNVKYARTNGVSTVNGKQQFYPAFRDEITGRVELARFRNGDAAPMHLICGLPEDWAVSHDEYGLINKVKRSITAGFLREGVFFTRLEAAAFAGPSE